jgi:CHASE3 domain sensor protein
MQIYYLESVISALFFLIVGMMAYWLKRSDQRITKLEQRLDEIVKNYLDRFDELKDSIHLSTEKINNSMAEMNAEIKTITIIVRNLSEKFTEMNKY